jgi:hypothetical protein
MRAEYGVGFDEFMGNSLIIMNGEASLSPLGTTNSLIKASLIRQKGQLQPPKPG